ncbi:hypothetical protein ILYODFUR_017805 [Ilyodon furcidens]|uniref:Uncharacterized protein n=1 Tax=Ilyodon furcidens TaxID=33524 RepID=A0ABV0U6J7_9TELE
MQTGSDPNSFNSSVQLTGSRMLTQRGSVCFPFKTQHIKHVNVLTIMCLVWKDLLPSELERKRIQTELFMYNFRSSRLLDPSSRKQRANLLQMILSSTDSS